MEWSFLLKCPTSHPPFDESTAPPPNLTNAPSAATDGAFFFKLRLILRRCRSQPVITGMPEHSVASWLNRDRRFSRSRLSQNRYCEAILDAGPGVPQNIAAQTNRSASPPRQAKWRSPARSIDPMNLEKQKHQQSGREGLPEIAGREILRDQLQGIPTGHAGSGSGHDRKLNEGSKH